MQGHSEHWAWTCLIPGRWTAILFLLLSLSGCSSSIYGWQVRTNSTEMAPSFHPGQLQAQPMAVLGAISMPALRGNEAALSSYLEDVLKKVAPEWQIVSPRNILSRINARGLTNDYAAMRTLFEDSHILERHALKRIGEVLAVRYAFQPRLASFTQTMTERWKFPGLDLRLFQTRSSIMRLSLYLWDIETGELLWASSAETTMENEAFSQDPVYMEDIARATFGGMIADLLNRRRASKYTPINKVLDNLIKEAIPEEKPKENDSAASGGSK